jgi:hypothetical protein
MELIVLEVPGPLRRCDMGVYTSSFPLKTEVTHSLSL